MASGQPENLMQCASCGAWVPRSEQRCWLCQGELSVESIRAPATSAKPAAPPQFALSSLLLVLTLFCLVFGLWSAAPGMIVPLLLVVVPALGRMMAAGRVAERKGESLSLARMAGHFFVGVGLVILAWIGAGVALLGACVVMFEALGSGNDQIAPGRIMVASGIAAIVVFLALLVITWPRSRKS